MVNFLILSADPSNESSFLFIIAATSAGHHLQPDLTFIPYIIDPFGDEHLVSGGTDRAGFYTWYISCTTEQFYIWGG